jgi:hypothetical protein
MLIDLLVVMVIWGALSFVLGLFGLPFSVTFPLAVSIFFAYELLTTKEPE